ncbi:MULTISPECIES: hypothetical protein [unclassified Treponema]|uniref:hypothetical protein n=1 Tax=unclassified Treponema TaxID=2638727 RepID=UPI0020A321A1|nr:MULTISPECIES: hypothetical protein [unclassified Treponema]UTC67472.1 hypothetical protein E4O06_02025 [Treponema sp. OMZ 789]UTC70200.1 hypothetical protein E4O01_02015 [Treponema sp. OMZ 790]UTC72915.1 hypothetical protein E4O02_02015 [Treponema sp. OMZ 791]
MEKNSIAADIKSILHEQIDLIDNIYKLQKAMYQGVLDRNWQESEKNLNCLNDASVKFLNLDKKLYGLLNADESNFQEFDFHLQTKQFASSDKKKIDSLYEKLKEKVFYSKIENDVFSNYVSHAQALVKGVVDIISEDRNGKCYTCTGKRINTDIKSLVLNEVL